MRTLLAPAVLLSVTGIQIAIASSANISNISNDRFTPLITLIPALVYTLILTRLSPSN